MSCSEARVNDIIVNPGPCVSVFPAQLVAGGPAFLDLLGWRRRGLFVSLLIVMPREEGGKKMSP